MEKDNLFNRKTTANCLPGPIWPHITFRNLFVLDTILPRLQPPLTKILFSTSHQFSSFFSVSILLTAGVLKTGKLYSIQIAKGVKN